MAKPVKKQGEERAQRRFGCGTGCGCGPQDASDLSEDEGPSQADIDTFSDVTRVCPECKSEVYDEAEVCWKCGHMFSAPERPMPRWVLVVIALVVLAFVVPLVWSLMR